MSYCELADVQRLNLNRTYNDNSKPTSTQVESMITDAATVIDALLSVWLVTTPVDSTNSPYSYAILKVVNALGAAADAENSAYFGFDKNTSSHGDWLKEQFDEMMERILNWLSGKTGVKKLALIDVRRTQITTVLTTSTPQVRPGGTKADQEIFTSLALQDFVEAYKISTLNEEIFKAGETYETDDLD